ncbi:anthranilate phosphoribosyltransferase [Aestuariispira insulae]|uniref:Anthranilate phosphoribosyltransferase n=2 Tax=Aestuariispira insulae TaxID=1461337 RepID=A0A3D9H3Z9_9PROT|nr:anthranilate phosphoribosyltransferase [Aestuariispira insulae]
MDHPFAKYVRILGKGPGISRDLGAEEAYEAFSMVLKGEVEPLQLGAFLCLMRYKKETPVELAAFVRAVKDTMSPAPDIAVDLDWPSYADRHRQLPWFVLSALMLAQNGVRIFMHGIEGFSEGLMPTRPVLRALGLPILRDWDGVVQALDHGNFAYMGLEDFAPSLEKLFGLRSLLGLRSPVNSLSRELNVLDAPAQLQGVFHPTYSDPHRESGRISGQKNLSVFKGGGGEVQCNPYKPIKIFGLRDGQPHDVTWPASMTGTAYNWREEPLELARIVALWRGEVDEADFGHAVAAIIDTAAVALYTMGRAEEPEEARAMARAMWHDRTE